MYNLYMLSFINRTGTRLSWGNRIGTSAYHIVRMGADVVYIRIVWVARHTTDTSEPV